MVFVSKATYKVCSEKKFTHICMYYANSGRASVKSLRSAKSRHPEDSKLVRQVHLVQKIPPESMIEQKKIFCENMIFVKNYLHKKVLMHICDFHVKSVSFSW